MSRDSAFMTPSLLTEAVATTPGISAQVAMLAVQRSNKSWHGFIGQSKIVTRIKFHIAGAKRVNSQIGTVLLLGTSGSGKSALALSMAKEIGTKCVKVKSACQWSKRAIHEKIPRSNEGSLSGTTGIT